MHGWWSHRLLAGNCLRSKLLGLAARSRLDDCALVDPFLIDTLDNAITLSTSILRHHDQHWLSLDY
jgi:hypothetical protein